VARTIFQEGISDMKIMIEVQEGLSIQREHVAAVKSSENGKTCTVFTVGQSAVDGGFLIKEKYEAIMDHIHAPENDVIEAAQALIKVLDEAAPHMQDIAEVAAAVKQPYVGPNFADEIEDLRIALKQAE
jgi:hypothetical protein